MNQEVRDRVVGKISDLATKRNKTHALLLHRGESVHEFCSPNIQRTVAPQKPIENIESHSDDCMCSACFII